MILLKLDNLQILLTINCVIIIFGGILHNFIIRLIKLDVIIVFELIF